MRRHLLAPLVVFAITAACTAPAVPVHFVPLPRDAAPGIARQTIAETFDQLGYHVVDHEERIGLVTTAWRYQRTILGQTRHRVLVRLAPPEAPGLALCVPREVHDGAGWKPRGEDVDRRQELVAALTARLDRRESAREPLDPAEIP